jgi:hypothetical protein
MSEEFDLGDRVSVVPTANVLPHPQGEFDPWADADGAAAPFGAEADPAPKQGGPGLPVGYDPSKNTPKKVKKKQAAPPRGKRPVPERTSISRKETELLTKFRETFGLQRISVAEGTLTRKDPDNPDSNVELRFGFRGMNYEDYQWVLEKAAEMQQTPMLVAFSWKIAVCSIGVASFEGSPIWEVLGFTPENVNDVRDPMYPHIGLRFQAADAFCAELTSSLFDTVEHLYSLYEEKVDKQYMPGAKKREEKKEEGDEEVPLAQSESVS